MPRDEPLRDSDDLAVRRFFTSGRLVASTARLANNEPIGQPNCGCDATKPRCAWVRAHSIDIGAESPHSPPTPTPCMKRNAVAITAPRMPIAAASRKTEASGDAIEMIRGGPTVPAHHLCIFQPWHFHGRHDQLPEFAFQIEDEPDQIMESA